MLYALSAIPLLAVIYFILKPRRELRLGYRCTFDYVSFEDFAQNRVSCMYTLGFTPHLSSDLPRLIGPSLDYTNRFYTLGVF